KPFAIGRKPRACLVELARVGEGAALRTIRPHEVQIPVTVRCLRAEDNPAARVQLGGKLCIARRRISGKGRAVESQQDDEHEVETKPHPDPLPFTKREGNLRWHRVRLTEQRSGTGASSSPRPE